MAKKSAPSAWDKFKAAPDGIGDLCEFIVSGESLAAFAVLKGVAYNTVLNWINAEPQRAADYARAREDRADFVFDQLDEVSNKAQRARTAVAVAGLRLKSDNIKWKLGRMNPKKYGDKIEIDQRTTLTDLTEEQLDARLAALEAKRRAAEAADVGINPG